MKRLVYSPKAYVFVKTEQNGIQNLSDYVVKGQVNRIINAVSSAEVVIRNPDMIWTQGARQGNPIFRPMDPVTIWLERIKGYPVQVFTGYLDKTPYLQLYPGVCRLTASCSLKRLMYTFWDPALPFTNTFLQKYGWIGDYSTGLLISPAAANKDLLKNDVAKPMMDDGSIGDLLFAILKNVAEWNPDGIRIEALPPDIIPKVEAIYNAYAEDSEAMHKYIQSFIKRFVGDGKYGDESGSGGGGTVGPGGEATGEVKGAERIIPIMEGIANDHNIPPELAITTSMMETGLGRDMYNESSAASGWFQWTPSSFDGAPGSYIKCGHPRNLKFEQNSDLGIATGAFCLSAQLAAQQRPSFRRNLRDWTMYVQGVTCGNNPLYCGGEWERKLEQAKALISKYGGSARASSSSVLKVGGPDTTATAAASGPRGQKETNEPLSDEDKVAPPVAPSDVTTDEWGWNPAASHEGIDLITDGAKPLYACVRAKVIDARNSGWWTQGASGDISRGDGVVRIMALDEVGDVKKGMIFGYGHAENCQVKVGDIVEPGTRLANTGLANAWHTHWFVGDPGTDARDGTRDPRPFWDAFKKGKAPLGSGGVTPGGGGGGTSGGVPYESVLSTAKAAAFVTSMEFPGIMEAMEAQALTGPRSLLNDKPIMPFIEQLTGASLRSFQSLPNGDFYAFYPDYFGNMTDSAPYWHIYDIEILDGSIDLTDEALATHVFAIGDTLPPPGIEAFERMRSTGVVNISNVAQSGFNTAPQSRNDDDGKNQRDEARKDRTEAKNRIASDPSQVMDFLKRYGARPHVEEAPMVRNQFFEAFLAWHTFQLMWSRQFLTEFQFTFMPELYPGGLVGFPEHGVQCYIDQVTHSFDYENGFETTAALSAPASLSNDKISTDPLQFGMVRAATEK